MDYQTRRVLGTNTPYSTSYKGAATLIIESGVLYTLSQVCALLSDCQWWVYFGLNLKPTVTAH